MMLPPEIISQVMRRLDQQQLLRMGLVDKQWLQLSVTALQQAVFKCPERNWHASVSSLAQWLQRRGNQLQVCSPATATKQVPAQLPWPAKASREKPMILLTMQFLDIIAHVAGAIADTMRQPFSPCMRKSFMLLMQAKIAHSI